MPKLVDELLLKNILKVKYPFLNDDSIGQLLSISEYKVVKNKGIVISAGETRKVFFFIIEGTFRGYFINTAEEEMNIFLRVGPTFFGSTDNLFENKATKFTFESILESQILLFDFEEFEALAFKNPLLMQLYLTELKSNHQNLVYRLESLIDRQPQQRYVELLKKHPKLFQSAFNKHIANFLGITPVSLSRIISRVKKHGENNSVE